MAQDTPSRSPSPEHEQPSTPEAGRPPGELGGHTVQPWEQDAVPPTTNPNSKDVPPPEMGTKEARAPGPGAGAKTTAAPGNQPSGATPGHGRSVATGTTAAAERATTLPGSEGASEAAASSEAAAPKEPAADELPPGMTRPSRPPVYKPQNGHEPAPRPPPAQAAQAKAQGPPTDGDALVEAITKAIAENLAKAFHQSVAQAVRDFMPLSGRTIAQPKLDVGAKLRKAPAKKPKQDDAPGTAEAGDASPLAGGAPVAPTKPQEAKPAPQVDPSAQTPLGKPLDQPKPSQYGGTIEPTDEAAKAKLAAAGNPANPAIGQPAQESADRESREGNLA